MPSLVGQVFFYVYNCACTTVHLHLHVHVHVHVDGPRTQDQGQLLPICFSSLGLVIGM